MHFLLFILDSMLPEPCFDQVAQEVKEAIDSGDVPIPSAATLSRARFLES